MECEKGKVVHFIRANYGRTRLEPCNDLYSNWNLNCLSKGSEQIMRERCDQKRSCDVEAENSVFGDPCFGTIKYLEMQYRCGPRKDGTTEVSDRTTPKGLIQIISVCEHRKLHVECQEGEVIHVIRANYGRTHLEPCKEDTYWNWNLNCLSNTSNKITRERCDQKTSCEIEATNSIFGDPCLGTIKYLEMQYRCDARKDGTTEVSDGTTSKGLIQTTSVCEHRKLHVECQEGEVIHFIRANYGRTRLEPCKDATYMNWNLNCLSSSSEQIMRERCDQKRVCDVEATNSIFGDPCFGTIKYLEMQYRCGPRKDGTEETDGTTPKDETTISITEIKTSTRGPIIGEAGNSNQATSSENTSPTVSTISFIDVTTHSPEDSYPTDPTISFIDTPIKSPKETFTPAISSTSTQSTITTSTLPYAMVPGTECYENDLECLKFVCPDDTGIYPHPTNGKLFVLCMKGKPKVKRCGVIVFPKNFKTCVSS